MKIKFSTFWKTAWSTFRVHSSASRNSIASQKFRLVFSTLTRFFRVKVLTRSQNFWLESIVSTRRWIDPKWAGGVDCGQLPPGFQGGLPVLSSHPQEHSVKKKSRHNPAANSKVVKGTRLPDVLKPPPARPRGQGQCQPVPKAPLESPISPPSIGSI